MRKRDIIIKSYQAAFKQYGAAPKALKWTSKEAATLRYEQLVADIAFKGKSVLDVGCGFGDIIPFIEEKAKNFVYTGVDMVPEFIKEAKRLHPEHNFIERDYFSKPLKEKFDVILSSGTMNSMLEKGYKWRYNAVRTMFEHTLEILAFNMAGNHPQPQNNPKSSIWYADSHVIREYCQKLLSNSSSGLQSANNGGSRLQSANNSSSGLQSAPGKVILKENYHPKDFTIVMFKS